jgi:uncharacterized protein YegP (UPF0339 family)
MKNRCKFEVRTQPNGKLDFVFKAGNGQILAQSETYESMHGVLNAIAVMRKNVADAKITRDAPSEAAWRQPQSVLRNLA